MDKEKEIEEMAKELHCATNESYISCRKIARILVERRGYGNVKQAISDFAGEVFKGLSEVLAKKHITSANEVKQIIRGAEEHYGGTN